MPEWLPLTSEPELMALLKPQDDAPPPVPAAAAKASAPPPLPGQAPGRSAAGSAATRPTAFSGQTLLKRAGAQDRWLEKRTLDGAPWYHNEGTGEVSWDMPPALAGKDPNMRDDGNWVWVPDEKLGFVTAEKVSGTVEAGLTVKLENGMRHQVAAGAKVFPLTRSALIRCVPRAGPAPRTSRCPARKPAGYCPASPPEPPPAPGPRRPARERAAAAVGATAVVAAAPAGWSRTWSCSTPSTKE